MDPVYPSETDELKRRLGGLPVKARVAFALACAERLTRYSRHPVGSETYESARAARRLARQFIGGAAIDPGELDALAQRLESSPDIDDDDVAASAFVLECLRAGDVHSAVWAAERAFDARARAAEKGMVFTVYTPEIEAALLSDPELQGELARQRADLGALELDPHSAAEIAGHEDDRAGRPDNG